MAATPAIQVQRIDVGSSAGTQTDCPSYATKPSSTAPWSRGSRLPVAWGTE
jgi:hypothetical protein